MDNTSWTQHGARSQYMADELDCHTSFSECLSSVFSIPSNREIVSLSNSAPSISMGLVKGQVKGMNIIHSTARTLWTRKRLSLPESTGTDVM